MSRAPTQWTLRTPTRGTDPHQLSLRPAARRQPLQDSKKRQGQNIRRPLSPGPARCAHTKTTQDRTQGENHRVHLALTTRGSPDQSNLGVVKKCINTKPKPRNQAANSRRVQHNTRHARFGRGPHPQTIGGSK